MYYSLFLQYPQWESQCQKYSKSLHNIRKWEMLFTVHFCLRISQHLYMWSNVPQSYSTDRILINAICLYDICKGKGKRRCSGKFCWLYGSHESRWEHITRNMFAIWLWWNVSIHTVYSVKEAHAFLLGHKQWGLILGRKETRLNMNEWLRVASQTWRSG